MHMAANFGRSYRKGNRSKQFEDLRAEFVAQEEESQRSSGGPPGSSGLAGEWNDVPSREVTENARAEAINKFIAAVGGPDQKTYVMAEVNQGGGSEEAGLDKVHWCSECGNPSCRLPPKACRSIGRRQTQQTLKTYLSLKLPECIQAERLCHFIEECEDRVRAREEMKGPKRAERAKRLGQNVSNDAVL